MMMNNIEMGYSISSTKTYWCHLCKKEFQKLFIENTDIQCRFCSNNFCEEITQDNTNDHPSTFQPFERNPTTRQNRPRTSSSFLDLLISMLSQQEETDMESIINYIMQNDTNRYGNPPASKNIVDNLDKITVTEDNIKCLRKDSSILEDDHSCSICKDLFELKQDLLYLPCKHVYHEECILPWLKERNTCPTCRYELPTDDNDYETKKSSL